MGTRLVQLTDEHGGTIAIDGGERAVMEPMTDVFLAIEEEIGRARSKFPAFHSQHEAYAVILEELDEFWEKVRRDEDGRQELIQVAAMAVAAYRECYTPLRGGK
jgi:hypothetical protein